MFRMRRSSPTFLKLTTICDVSHVISFPLPYIFSHKRGRPGYEANNILGGKLGQFGGGGGEVELSGGEASPAFPPPPLPLR